MKQKIWFSVVDAKNAQDLSDLDHLSEIIWGANPNAKKGDMILMYRTAPYSDIAYVFRAKSDARPTKREDKTDTGHVIELSAKARLTTPVSLKDLKTDPLLKHWSFARNQQGTLRRKKDIREEGYWALLKKLILKKNKSVNVFDRADRPKKQLSKKRGTAAPLKVFISYASQDLPKIKKLHAKLRKDTSCEFWLDKINLITSNNWREVIETAINNADAIILCLSTTSYQKIGVVQQEIKWALEIADRQPEGTSCIFPVKLEPCQVQTRLLRWQFAELFKNGEYQKLLEGLNERALFLGKKA